MEPGPASERSLVSRLASISLASITIFAILIIMLHFLRPDLDPLQRPTSEYAVGQYGYLMTAAFFCMSIATFTLVIILNKKMRGKARSIIGLILLTTWGVAVLIAMIFPIDAEGALPTTAGKIHKTNGPVAFLSLALGVLFVSLWFKHDENMRLLYPAALILSLIMLLIFVCVGISFRMKLGFVGILQRIYLVIVITWFLLTLSRLQKVERKM
jgi:Protein of unknown function (DUF998)